jgi:hypothetical protein
MVDPMTIHKPTGEPRLASLASWAVLAASFGLSASTWIALADLAGFTDTIAGFRLAWLMPVAVDGYVVVALVLWMAPVPAAVARFARANTYAAASIGVAAQSAFHAFLIHDQTGVWWRTVLAAVVGALPPAGAALSVHMRALLRRESRQPVLEVRAELPTGPVPALEPVEVPPEPAVSAEVSPEPAPVEVPPELPPVEPAGDAARNGRVRRPSAETRRLARALEAGDSSLTREEIADLLGVTTRRLREVLANGRQPAEGR